MNTPIYAKEHEKFIKKQVLYAQISEESVEGGVLVYEDEKLTIPVKSTTLLDLFMKGMLIINVSVTIPDDDRSNEIAHIVPIGCVETSDAHIIVAAKLGGIEITFVGHDEPAEE